MKKVINYKVQKEEWETLKDEAFKKLNAKATIDGFRKGKAPRSMFERNYPGQIVMEAADTAVDKEYRRIIMEGKILPIIEPKIDIVKVSDEELFFKIIKFSFLQKRKTLINSLSNSGLMPKDLLEEMLNDLGIDLRVRAEQLSLEEFAKMTDYIKTNIQE